MSAEAKWKVAIELESDDGYLSRGASVSFSGSWTSDDGSISASERIAIDLANLLIAVQKDLVGVNGDKISKCFSREIESLEQ